MTRPRPTAIPQARRVVLVNGDPDVVRLLDTTLAGGHYDMVFVAPDGRAYEQIRDIRPDLVVLRSDMRHPASLELLTILKLDPLTRGIPVITLAADDLDEASEEADRDDLPALSEPFVPSPAPRWLN